MLFLQWKDQAPHYFLRKNEVPHYFFRKKWSSSLFLGNKCYFFFEEIMRCLIFCWRNAGVPNLFCSKIMKCLFFFFKKWSGTWACNLKSPANIISALKTSGASLFLEEKKKHFTISSEKKTKCHIISSEQNLAPNYVFKKKWGCSLFLKKTHWFFFWRHNAELHFFWRNHEAPHFF